MRHVTYADQSLLIGDEAADLLMRYATALGQSGGADAVTLRALGSDGNDVDATFLLGPGSVLMVETANTETPEPDNLAVTAYLRERVDALTRPFGLGADDRAPGDD
ncbi:hypothetical protein [Leifsonia sp. fls2-241-R2A-40a]|uniref:hypothetical protein n=1 Tax=Leifsonia sp. fls2-241-R2A-40a TaxID=3040290 RepID=UPI002549E696|nr:hypothetical protein [Leifsonia sp. fls2-241-R2A-40a]